MKNILKLIVSKPMKYSKNVDTLLFQLIITTSQREKNIEKTFECRRSKKVKNSGFRGPGRKLGNLGKLGKLGILFPTFSPPTFRF